MFKNEVIISSEDRQRLICLLKEANEILDKYPYFSYNAGHTSTITAMSRAKSAVKNAYTECWLLYDDKSEDSYV